MPGTSLSPQAKVATLTLPTKDTRVAASVWPAAYGTILFLAEINLPAPTTQELLGKLTDKLETTWHSDRFFTMDNDQALETIISELNPILSERSRLMGNPLAPRYQFILALYQAGNLSLASIGRLNTLLVSDEHVTNVLGLAPSKMRSVAKPTFEFITTGNLKPGETLLLSSSCLLDYFSTDKIRSLFNDNAPGAALRNIEQYVSSLPTHSPMGLLALKLTASDQITGTEPSLAKLIHTKDQTKNLLKPSMWNYLKEKTQGLSMPRLPKFDKQPKTPSFNKVETQPEPEPIKQIDVAKISWHTKFKTLLSKLATKVNKLVEKLAWLKSRNSIKEKIEITISIYIIRWQQFNLTKKIVAIIGMFALLVFAGSIVRLGKNSLAEQDHYNYTRLLAKITQEQSNIEAALIYRDDNKAKLGLKNLQEMIATLPQDSKNQKEQAAALAKSLAWLENRVARKTEITTLKAWGSLLDKPNQWFGLQKISNLILTFTKDGQVAYLNQDGKVVELPSLGPKTSSLVKAIGLGKFIWLLNSAGDQFWFDPVSKTTSQITDKLNVKDAVFYENNIYYISSENPGIWRTSKTANGFAKPVRWLKGAEALPVNDQAIGIDGNVYVAGQDLNKYIKGIKQDFSITTLEPPLKSVNKIYTSATVDYIYLVDNSDKRLVIFDKKARLVAQLSFANLNVSDMLVDITNRDLYVLIDSTVFKLNLVEYGS